MSEKKSLGGQIFSFVKVIIGIFCAIIILLILMIVIPNVMRGCQASKAGVSQQRVGY